MNLHQTMHRLMKQDLIIYLNWTKIEFQSQIIKKKKKRLYNLIDVDHLFQVNFIISIYVLS